MTFSKADDELICYCIDEKSAYCMYSVLKLLITASSAVSGDVEMSLSFVCVAGLDEGLISSSRIRLHGGVEACARRPFNYLTDNRIFPVFANIVRTIRKEQALITLIVNVIRILFTY